MRAQNWLDDYRLDNGAPDTLALRVSMPWRDAPFRVHPNEEWVGCVLYDGQVWWLVHPGIQPCVKGAYKATLHLCAYEDGTLWLLPNTHPAPGQFTNSWYDSWLAAVAEGHQRWITAFKNGEEQRYEHRPAKRQARPHRHVEEEW